MVEKTERLTIKLLPNDKQTLKYLALSEGESMAFVIRQLIRQADKQKHVVGSDKQQAGGINHGTSNY
ncbi:MAG: hypothetical protein KDE56_02010 [Anaerolineales bacterium]|nr:hypothetical protein [Anaerolineales bacterium]